VQLDPEFIGLLGAWVVRELVAYFRAQRRGVSDAVPPRETATASDSGNFPAIMLPEGLASRRELDALAAVVKELHAQVVELAKVIAVLKDRANMAD